MEATCKRNSLVVSLHDVHPGSFQQIEEQRNLLKRCGIKLSSLLVVPDFHHRFPVNKNEVFLKALSDFQEQGDEIVLHGFYHDRKGQEDKWKHFFWNRLYSNKEAEFLDLETQEMEGRIQKALKDFQAYGWKVKGFVAPTWLMKKELPLILRQKEFSYTTSLAEFIPLQEGEGAIASQALCWSVRSFWRRSLSLAWNPYLLHKLKKQRCNLIRIALHPLDLEFRSTRRQISDILFSLMDEGYEAMSYSDYLVSCSTRSESHCFNIL